MFDFSSEQGLWGLFVSSFVSATVLPGGSEAVLIVVLHEHPDLWWHAVGVASLGNTLGGATSYLVGRMFPNNTQSRAIIALHKYGYWALLFSWVPLIGDALCVAAGWLRFNPWLSLALLAIGKLLRYLLVAGGWTWMEKVLLPMFSA